jgi:Polyketide cyclase / dehydrase and lipid transport
MPRYRATLETTRRLERVFTYLSNLSNSPEWNPGVIKASGGDDGPLGCGSTFDVRAEVLGRKIRFNYQIIAFDPPRSVTLRGDSALAVAIEQIDLAPTRTGCRITYDADLKPKGALMMLEPLLARRFKADCERAIAGLKQTLGD